MKNMFPALMLLTIVAGCSVTDTQNFQFALLGDNPYSPVTYPKYEHLIEHVNAQSNIQWVLHVGDVKKGAVSCSDEELQSYFNLNQRYNRPFIVTPGDNDWLDCKSQASGSFDEYERLEAFRRIFYPVPNYSTGRNPMPVVQQSSVDSDFPEFVENAMWEKGGIIFATVHVLGLTEDPTDVAQLDRRVAAATAWIRRAFSQSRSTNANGLFIAMQADPWIFFGLPALAGRICPGCREPRPTLEWLYPLLAEEALSFGKPVVLAHGDTHIFRVDKPLYTDRGALVSNFTRVESFGDPLVHWVNVLVEPESPWVFSFREQLVSEE